MRSTQSSLQKKQTALIENQPLPPEAVNALRQTWNNFDLAGVYQLFLPPNSGNGQIIGFRINNTILAQLFPGNTPVDGALLRFYMGADISAGREGIQPKICPIVQVILPGEDPLDYNRCFAIKWTTEIEMPNRSDATFAPDGGAEGIIQRKDLSSKSDEVPRAFTPITSKLVWDFVGNWIQANINEQLFFNPQFYDDRVQFYTFCEGDTKALWEIFAQREDNSDNKGLIVYCGVYRESDPTDLQPFPFRFVLWMNQQSVAPNPHFYEFSTPCPPYCGDKCNVPTIPPKVY